MYYLSANSCNKAPVSNCYRVDSRGHCLQCVTGYYYDEEKFDCLEVPRAYLLQNCISYSRFNFCSKCNADSYLTDTGNCLPVPVRIEHCNEYQTENPGICLQCFSGFVLSHDGSKCSAVSELDPDALDENCGSYSRFKCLDCEAPYVLSPSFYSEYQPLLHDSDFSAFMWNTFFSFSDRQFVFRTCEKPSSSNCDETNPYLLNCKSCSDGFYLNGLSNVCEPDPPAQIFDCIRYSSDSVCAECVSGKHLNSTGNLCEDDVEIDKCAIYDGTAQVTTKCKQCLETHKLSANSQTCEGNIFSEKS